MRQIGLFVAVLFLFSSCAVSGNGRETAAKLAGPVADVVLTPDVGGKGVAISEEFIGLSYETRMALPDGNDRYYFHPQTPQLPTLFKGLGIKSLRVGGNTADRDTVNIPTDRDLHALFEFAKAADCKIIYNLRLKGVTDPTDDVRIVKYIMGNYADVVSSFTLGNEPDFYFKDFAAYFEEYKKFSDAILKEVPNAKFCGPSTAGHQEWGVSLAEKVPGELAYVSLHTYPGGNAQAAGNPEQARAHILSPDMEKFYERYYANFATGIAKEHLGYRLEECNSLYNGGAANISNSFASGIWALDFMYWYAAHGCLGVNFHTGTTPNPPDDRVPGGYDAFWTSPTGLRLHPLSYAMKAFDIGAHGKIVPMGVVTNGKEEPNVTAYAVVRKGAGNEMYVTVMNREAGAKGRDYSVVVQAGPFTHAEMMVLTAPDDGVLEGETLGGATIAGDGKWEGKWTAVSAGETPGTFGLTLRKTSAVIVRFRP